MSFLAKIPAALYWRTIRRILPRRVSRWAGVKTHLTRRWLDDVLLPDHFHYHRDRPNYENALIFGLKGSVKNGDCITIIGGGYGITAVIASQLAGPLGNVLVFEGSRKQFEICNSVLRGNNFPAPVDIRHATVGAGIGVYGSDDERASILPAEDLGKCDVLQMDCEGAELTILSSMLIRPRVVLVETHGFLGATSNEVRRVLCDLGYSVDDLGLAEIDVAEICLERDIRVLRAQRK